MSLFCVLVCWVGGEGGLVGGWVGREVYLCSFVILFLVLLCCVVLCYVMLCYLRLCCVMSGVFCIVLCCFDLFRSVVLCFVV